MCVNVTGAPDDPHEGWKSVAVVGCNDRITQIHVSSLLKSHGIECSMEGSIVWGVSVPTKDADRSIEILKQDLVTRHYWIILYEGKKEHRYSTPDKLWTTERPQKKYEDLIRLKQYDRSTDLGAVLRHPDVKAAVRKFPYVAKIKTLEREYLDRDGKVRIGHEVNLELVASPNKDTGEWGFDFQVWGEGKSVERFGGFGELEHRDSAK
jgi:hypothetical protein